MVCKKYLMEKREESKKQKREEDKEGGDGKAEEEVKEKTEEEESKEEGEEKTEVEKEKEAEEKKPVEGSDPPEIREEDGVRPRAQERMLRKPEILSDESDVEDSKEDLKNLLPKEEAFSESDNEDSQENDQDFDASMYYDDPDLLDTTDAGDPPPNISVKEEDGKFKLSIKRETPKSKPKKRKIENTDGKSFVCEIEGCNYKANFQTLLRRHIVHVHEKVRYNCAFCDVKGIGVDGLRKHVKGHHSERPWRKDDHPQSDPSEIKEDQTFTCDIESCTFTAPNRWTLRAHKETHKTSENGPKQEKLWYKDEDNYVCKVCNYKSTKPGTTRIHIERHHGDRTCFHCDYKCNDIQIMKDHIVSEHGGEETKCNYCVKTFASREGLKRHERLIHEEQTKPDAVMQACDQCTFTCYSSYRLRRHVRNVHKWKELDCKFCDKRFNSLEGLTKHQRLIHEEEINPGGELLFCDQCDYQGYGEYRLKRHQQNLHRESIHQCDQCDYHSPRKYSLTKHIEAVHMGIKRKRRGERCSECNFECPNRKILAAHMETVHNTAIELYYCDQCTFSSVYKSSLDNHKRMKHGPVVLTTLAKLQTFYCDYCEFSSKYKVTVNNHINSKHLGIKFQCDICDYSCGSQQVIILYPVTMIILFPGRC